VIEFGFVPESRFVATTAIGAEFAGVRIVGTVTIDAARRRFPKFLSRLVAFTAIGDCMLSAQRVVRVVVGEGHDIQTQNVGVAT
jgi:hypothetical protein